MGKPRLLKTKTDFPHRQAIVEGLKTGAVLKREEWTIPTTRLKEAYGIRLRIAKNPDISGSVDDKRALVADMETFVDNLTGVLDGTATSFSITCTDGRKYWLFEETITGAFLGCLALGRDDQS
jgi:hypothetical protein